MIKTIPCLKRIATAYRVSRKTNQLPKAQYMIRRKIQPTWKQLPVSLHLLTLLLLLTLTACGSPASADPTPPTIHYGEDICEFCGMIVSEERYAAGYLTPDGEAYIFDDIGDMVQAHLQNQDEEAVFFVHNHEDHTWMRAETAYFVLSPDLPTPMLSGLAAFPTAKEAEHLNDELGGELLTFEELLTYYRENPATPVFSGQTGD